MLADYKARLAQIRRPLWAVLLWAYVATIGYVILGSWIYPFWWKRFLLEGGLWQLAYWKFGFQFLTTWFAFYHPLAVTLFVAFVAGVLWVVHRSGRTHTVIPEQFAKGPPRWLLLVMTATATSTLVALALMEGRFETPDEAFTRMMAKSEVDLRESERRLTRAIFGIEAPKSGLYVYLDSEKLDQAFSSLQQDLATVLTRTTSSKSESLTAAANVSGIDLSKVATQQIQKSIDQAPTQPTPARQARWLIEQYLDLRLSEHLLETSDVTGVLAVESYQSREAREALAVRGVTLSNSQDKALSIGDAKVRLAKVSKTGAPVFYKGKVTIAQAPKGFEISFSALEGFKCQGLLKEGSVDQNIESCVRKNRGLCPLNVTIMGQILTASLHDRLINLELIPIAVW